VKKLEQELEVQKRLLQAQSEVLASTETETEDVGATEDESRQKEEAKQTVADTEDETARIAQPRSVSTPWTNELALELESELEQLPQGSNRLRHLLHTLLTSYHHLHQEHQALRADVSHLDADFFEELEDLKYQHSMALELVEEYERVLASMDNAGERS
jgi:chromosome segregation ATPase